LSYDSEDTGDMLLRSVWILPKRVRYNPENLIDTHSFECEVRQDATDCIIVTAGTNEIYGSVM
jgi:hypothetical protein